MSTGLECAFYRTPDDQWYYALEDWDAPRNAFDWHDYATFYGPFQSEEAADTHLSDNHANPGGMSIFHLTNDDLPYYQPYFDTARKPE